MSQFRLPSQISLDNLPTYPQPPLQRPSPLLIVSALYLVIGILVLALAFVVGAEIITWDVKGFLLTGWRLALFTSALALVALIAIVSACGLWLGKRWARPLALSLWVAGGTVALITDRSVAGPGERLQIYLLNMMLFPGLITGAILYGLPSIRRFFARPRKFRR